MEHTKYRRMVLFLFYKYCVVTVLRNPQTTNGMKGGVVLRKHIQMVKVIRHYWALNDRMDFIRNST